MKRIINTYFGGKGGTGTYQTIINHFRPHDCYIEGFLGGGSILLAKKPALVNIGIEINQSVCQIWQNQHHTMPGFDIRCESIFDFLDYFDFTPFRRVCLYLDPPYVLATRKSKNRYAYEFTDKDHIRLLERIRKLPANVDCLISTYPNQLYTELLKGWYEVKYKSLTRKGMADEILYMNFAVVDQLHDPTYAGLDYRDRERIKKKANRWKENFQNMPLFEQSAVFSAICQTYFHALPMASPASNGDTADTVTDTSPTGTLPTDVSSTDISPNQLNMFQL